MEMQTPEQRLAGLERSVRALNGSLAGLRATVAATQERLDGLVEELRRLQEPRRPRGRPRTR